MHQAVFLSFFIFLYVYNEVKIFLSVLLFYDCDAEVLRRKKGGVKSGMTPKSYWETKQSESGSCFFFFFF